MTISERTTEINFATGGRAVVLPTAVRDVVTLCGSIVGGPSAFSGADGTAAGITAGLLDAGAGKLSKAAFRDALAARGAEISFSTNDTRLSFSASCFPEDAKFVVERIADSLWRPHLAADELATEKTRALADLDDESGDTRAQAERALTRLVYAPNHPNYALTIHEEKQETANVTRNDMRSIASQYGTSHLALAIVGDVDAKKLRETVEKAFSKTPAGRARPQAAPTTASNRPDPKRENIILGDKANADVTIGSALGFTKDDDRYLPTALVNHLLGGSPVAHLFQTVRERDGLTYGTQSTLRGFSDQLDGYLQIWGTFAPQMLIRGTDTLLRETALFLKNGISEEQLAQVKEEITGSYAVALATTGGLARHLVRFMEDDKPISRIDEHPDFIRAVTLKEAQDAAAHLASLPLSIATAGSI